MQNQMIISIMARDRVGIVADVTAAIRQLDGNLADLSQTVLCGYFTMIVVASFPADVSTDDVRAAIGRYDRDQQLEIGIKAPEAAVYPEETGHAAGHYILTAAGPDSAGLVAAVSGYLREQGINILDLATHVAQGQYTMMLSVDLAPDSNVGDFKRRMQAALEPTGIRVELQHHEIFRATNEV